VTELGCSADCTAVDLAAEDQPTANPGPDRHHDRFADSAGGAGPVLGDGRQIAVVIDEYGQIQALGHNVRERNVGQGEVDGDDRDPAALIDLGGDPEPDRIDLIPDGLPHFLDSIN